MVQVEPKVDATQVKKQEKSLEGWDRKGVERPRADPRGRQEHDPQRPGGRQVSPGDG